MSAYLAYLALSSEMATFDEGLPHVARVEYISPQPILPQNTLDNEDSSPDNLLSSRGAGLSLSPIAIGAGKPNLSFDGLPQQTSGPHTLYIHPSIKFQLQWPLFQLFFWRHCY